MPSRRKPYLTVSKPTNVKPLVEIGMFAPKDMPWLASARKVEGYPFADYLYNRAKAAEDIRKYNRAWGFYLRRQSLDVQEAVEKIERLFKNSSTGTNFFVDRGETGR